jgi:hypothetical protein
LFRNQRERYIDDDEDEENIPPLHEDWLEPDEIGDRREQEERRFARRYGRRPGKIEENPVVIAPPDGQDSDEDSDSQEIPGCLQMWYRYQFKHLHYLLSR